MKTSVRHNFTYTPNRSTLINSWRIRAYVQNNMRRYTLPYNFTRPTRRLQRARFDNIAIVPASLLVHKEKYTAVAKRLPTGSVLIYAPTLPKQRRILEAVANFFRGYGHQVTTL